MTREEAINQVNRNLFKILSNEPTITAALAYKMIDQIYKDHEAQLEAKNEEIERLNADIECAKNMMKGLMDGVIITHKIAISKARSIVAMLFWEWRKHKRMYELSKLGSYLAITHLNNSTLSKLIFQQAYKQLKDNK